jgi:phosphatidylserine decarboxylase
MPKKKRKKIKKEFSKIFSAHIGEQLEAEAKHFLTLLEHYGVEGVFFVRKPDQEESVFVFSKDHKLSSYQSLLKSCSKISTIFTKATVDRIEKL